VYAVANITPTVQVDRQDGGSVMAGQPNESKSHYEGDSRWRGEVLARTFGLMFALTAVGCGGGLHRQGEWRAEVTLSYEEPIRGETIWADGLGRSQAAGVTVHGNYFLADRTALIIAATPYRIYNQSDGDVYAGEFQLGARYYIAEWNNPLPMALYAEVLGGVTLGRHSIPEDGSAFNFTQDTGIGFEAKLTDDVSWITGYRFKHLSNGNFFNDDNPSQNDHQIYTGISIRL